MSDSIFYVLNTTRQPASDILDYIHFDKVPAQKALWFVRAQHTSKQLHFNVKRKSGESAYLHDARTALLAAVNGEEIESPITMYCHEFGEDDFWSQQRLIANFGRDVGVSVWGLSKQPKSQFPGPNGRHDRVVDHIDRMKRATEHGIFEGTYQTNWLVPMGKEKDRYDNSVDTAGIDPEHAERLFQETEEDFLPFFYWAMPAIPKKYLGGYRIILKAIEFNCDNYWRSRALRNS